VHVVDEAANDFLAVYNPTVRRIRDAVPFLPLPQFTFAAWLIGLVAAVLALAMLGWQVAPGARWVRPVGYGFGIVMAANGMAHLVISVAQGRPMPGAYSAPLLLVASFYLLWALRAARAQA
jgi:hypothetical protein